MKVTEIQYHVVNLVSIPIPRRNRSDLSCEGFSPARVSFCNHRAIHCIINPSQKVSCRFFRSLHYYLLPQRAGIFQCCLECSYGNPLFSVSHWQPPGCEDDNRFRPIEWSKSQQQPRESNQPRPGQVTSTSKYFALVLKTKVLPIHSSSTHTRF